MSPQKQSTGAKKRADDLFSKIVRSSVGHCQRCGLTPPHWNQLQAAHIRRRAYSATRHLRENCWALCPSCHWKVDNDPRAFMELVDKTIGQDKLEELWDKSQAGVGKKYDWQASYEALKVLWAEQEAA